MRQKMINKEGLLNCPFCGSIFVRRKIGPQEDVVMFTCDSCGALVSFYGAEYEPYATEQWNSRPVFFKRSVIINLNNNQEFKKDKYTYSGKYIVKVEFIGDMVHQTYIEVDDNKVWLVVYQTQKEITKNQEIKEISRNLISAL